MKKSFVKTKTKLCFFNFQWPCLSTKGTALAGRHPGQVLGFKSSELPSAETLRSAYRDSGFFMPGGEVETWVHLL